MASGRVVFSHFLKKKTRNHDESVYIGNSQRKNDFKCYPFFNCTIDKVIRWFCTNSKMSAAICRRAVNDTNCGKKTEKWVAEGESNWWHEVRDKVPNHWVIVQLKSKKGGTNTPYTELLWRYSQQILMTLEKRKMLFSLIKLFAAILWICFYYRVNILPCNRF